MFCFIFLHLLYFLSSIRYLLKSNIIYFFLDFHMLISFTFSCFSHHTCYIRSFSSTYISFYNLFFDFLSFFFVPIILSFHSPSNHLFRFLTFFFIPLYYIYIFPFFFFRFFLSSFLSFLSLFSNLYLNLLLFSLMFLFFHSHAAFKHFSPCFEIFYHIRLIMPLSFLFHYQASLFFCLFFLYRFFLFFSFSFSTVLSVFSFFFLKSIVSLCSLKCR
ncbi:unnamed protein product [Acanthosepion pharaonis]|uniref:Uncharacterized protein n=1 Tax=Acanthosepion pharaonis TaxID=158019 RepID=A0A812DGM1_ACAPH|nr:unnamed protein product [Sepia pharaonis]